MGHAYDGDVRPRPLTRFAEIATIVGTLIAIVALIIQLTERHSGGTPTPAASASAGNASPTPQGGPTSNGNQFWTALNAPHAWGGHQSGIVLFVVGGFLLLVIFSVMYCAGLICEALGSESPAVVAVSFLALLIAGLTWVFWNLITRDGYLVALIFGLAFAGFVVLPIFDIAYEEGTERIKRRQRLDDGLDPHLRS